MIHALASCPHGLHRTVWSHKQSCQVSGPGHPESLQEGWTLSETCQDLERSITSRLAGGTCSKHNMASVQGSLCYFCMCRWCKMSFFILLFQKNPHNETQSKGHQRHTGKGVMGKEKTRQQSKTHLLLFTVEELFGPSTAACGLLLPAWQPLPLHCEKEATMTHRSDEVRALLTRQATPAASQAGSGAMIRSRQLRKEQGWM